MLDGPFAATVVHEGGWAGVVWEDGDLVEIDRISSLGAGIRLLDHPTAADEEDADLDAR